MNRDQLIDEAMRLVVVAYGDRRAEVSLEFLEHRFRASMQQVLEAKAALRTFLTTHLAEPSLSAGQAHWESIRVFAENTVKTNSRDILDWVEDMAFVEKFANDRTKEKEA